MTTAILPRSVERPTVVVDAVCPECGGDGSFTCFEGPGTEYSFGWLPREVERECPRCRGLGIVDALECVRCHRLEDDCTCDDDDFAEVA